MKRHPFRMGETVPRSHWPLITETRKLTNFTVGPLFFLEDRKEAWVIETQFELMYEAVGQSLAYESAFQQVRDKASELDFSHPTLKQKTKAVSRLPSGQNDTAQRFQLQ